MSQTGFWSVRKGKNQKEKGEMRFGPVAETVFVAFCGSVVTLYVTRTCVKVEAMFG